MQAISNILDNNVITLKPKNKLNNVNVNTVRHRAMYIADRLNDQKSLEFFYKCAWKIPEARLMNILEQAERGHSPARLFTYLAKLELQK